MIIYIFLNLPTIFSSKKNKFIFIFEGRISKIQYQKMAARKLLLVDQSLISLSHHRKISNARYISQILASYFAPHGTSMI